jgi:hypothetical protein
MLIYLKETHMKLLAIVLFSIFTTASFASDLSSTIKDIEMDKNAKCTETSTSWGLCFGIAPGTGGTCFYSVKFDCTSNSGDFGLKVKMKSVFGKTSVRKVIYLN